MLLPQIVTEDGIAGYPYSYIERHWDDMYLGLRCPVPVNINPYYLLNPISDKPISQARLNYD